MSEAAILVPRRPDNGHRDRLWSFTRRHWARWQIFGGVHDDGPFNRSAAINRAARVSDEWDAAVIIDADVLVSHSAVDRALEVALTGQPAVAYDCKRNLTAAHTEQVLSGKRSWQSYARAPRTHDISGAYVVPRWLWEEVNGFDEHFVGWGWEDVAFRIATETLSSKDLFRVPATLVHLWHPPSPEQNHGTLEENRRRVDRYRDAHWQKDLVWDLCHE